MEIVVIDQGPELFWFVSNAMVNEDVHLKHIKTKQAAIEHVFKDLPDIVIINGDDEDFNITELIAKFRNHAFLRNIQFIVSTGNSSLEFRRNLMLSGAGYILFKSKNGYTIPTLFFRNVLKWFLNIRGSDSNSFQDKGVEIKVEASGLTFGRLNSIFQDGTCLIENNLDLNNGEILEIENSIFDELAFKDIKFKIIKKNHTGRYYQYAHSYLCKIELTDDSIQMPILQSWIENNSQITKNKNIKVVYFENQSEYREEIRKTIKIDAKYCARGYKNLNDINFVLDYQKPDFILVNRSFITSDGQNFLKLKDYLKKHNCFIITYNTEASSKNELDKLKVEYPYALHANGVVELSTLNTMIDKVIAGKPKDIKNIVFGKHSPYSRINFPMKVEVSELGEFGITFKSNLKSDRFLALSLNSLFFNKIQLGKNQLFRVYDIKTGAIPLQRAIFVCQNNKERELVKEAMKKIKELGFDKFNE